MNRTFPDNVRFRKGSDPCLQRTLYNVLLAYGHHNRGVGYCQVSPRRLQPRQGCQPGPGLPGPPRHRLGLHRLPAVPATETGRGEGEAAE